jgi:hypothetical protein
LTAVLASASRTTPRNAASTILSYLRRSFTVAAAPARLARAKWGVSVARYPPDRE